MSKCLIVTGGGRGIGAEVSRKAAKQGYSVCVNFHRDQTSAQKLVRELEKEGANALAYPVSYTHLTLPTKDGV